MRYHPENAGLDAGSGPIPHNELLEYSVPFSRRVCIDLAAPPLRIAKSKLEDKGICLQADLTSIPIKTGSIDAVTCNHVLFHIPADKQAAAFRELWRVLRPGGIGVVVYRWHGHRSSPACEKLGGGSFVTVDHPSRTFQSQICITMDIHSIGSARRSGHSDIGLIHCRIIGNEFMREFVSDNWLGRAALQIFFRFPTIVSRALWQIRGLSGDRDLQRLADHLLERVFRF
jgi:SAM-dependent methyltransferase